jgi:hypothetical protein
VPGETNIEPRMLNDLTRVDDMVLMCCYNWLRRKVVVGLLYERRSPTLFIATRHHKS